MKTYHLHIQTLLQTALFPPDLHQMSAGIWEGISRTTFFADYNLDTEQAQLTKGRDGEASDNDTLPAIFCA